MESVLWKVIWKNNLFEVKIREDKGKVIKVEYMSWTC